jgi:hypothetical protein
LSKKSGSEVGNELMIGNVGYMTRENEVVVGYV